MVHKESVSQDLDGRRKWHTGAGPQACKCWEQGPQLAPQASGEGCGKQKPELRPRMESQRSEHKDEVGNGLLKPHLMLPTLTEIQRRMGLGMIIHIHKK